ncbi:phosphatase 2C-domain-containing protein [Aspergillus spectabilis]
MALLALTLLGFLSAVNATVVANYPVNAQLPPVARVLRPFEFVFSQGTFGGSDSQTAYSLSSAPSWLKVDSKSRTLSGTPRKEDAGSPTFDLIASDASGSATMQVTFIVTADEGPKAGKPLAPQLQAMGPTSSPSNIIVHSGDSFSISFDRETFGNTRPSTVYYGTSYPDNAPLPSWIGFDQSALRFYGTAPNIGPQTFSLNLVASDVSGFSAATVTFELTVSPHTLSFKQSAQTLFVTGGKELTSPRFASTLTLDGDKPASDVLTGTDIDAPDWLEVDRLSLLFRGKPPADGRDSNVTITVTDVYQDVATLVVSLQYSQFFRAGLDECDAVIGQYFTFTFNSSTLVNDSAELDVDLGQQVPWLHYNRDNKTLHGKVPSDAHPNTHTVRLTAREGTAEGNKTFTINTVAGEDKKGNGSSSGGSHSSYGDKAAIIAMAIFIPLGCVAIVLLLLYCRRRRQEWPKDEEGHGFEEKTPPPAPLGPGLSHCQPFERTAQGYPPAMGGVPLPESKPPQLELEPWWNVSSEARNEGTQPAPGKDNTFSSSIIDWGFIPMRDPEQDENKPPNEPAPKPNRLSFQSSPPRVRRGASNRSGGREPLRPIQPRRSMKRNSALSSRSKRWSKRSSGISSISTGLPVRLSGAGHGAGGFGPPGHGFVKVSWQNTQTSLQSEESGLGNLAPLFPRPPRPGDNYDYGKRMSVRTVDHDNMTISEPDSLEAFVQGRARSRHSSNPFITGPISRRVSSGLRALERARSSASRADTVRSATDNDDYRRRERPWSLAMSGSIYTDDYRHSAYLSSLSEESLNIQPLVALNNGPSQSSLAQHYSKIISPLPRFFSELSLNNNGRDGAGGAYVDDDHHNLSTAHRWSRSNPSLQNWRRLRKSPSTSSVPYDAKAPRTSSEGQDECCIYGVSAMQGWRISMEDAHAAVLDLQTKQSGSNDKPTDPDKRLAFFGVYDGHGGDKVALFAGENIHKIVSKQEAFSKGDIEQALKDGFLATDRAILEDPKYEEEVSGCTAAVSVISKQKIWVANAGDSRAVLGVKGRAKPLSFDHKPQNEGEKARISAAGGFVDFGRVNGNLALSRAIGDFEFKKSPELSPEQQIVTAYPDVTVHDVTDDDEFLVIACDGIWDCQSSQAVVEFVRRGIAAKQDLYRICENMMDNCLASNSETGGVGCDNMTMVIIGLLNGKTKEEWYNQIAERVANGDGPSEFRGPGIRNQFEENPEEYEIDNDRRPFSNDEELFDHTEEDQDIPNQVQRQDSDAGRNEREETPAPQSAEKPASNGSEHSNNTGTPQKPASSVIVRPAPAASFSAPPVLKPHSSAFPSVPY